MGRRDEEVKCAELGPVTPRQPGRDVLMFTFEFSRAMWTGTAPPL
jgi:hypothetical protein